MVGTTWQAHLTLPDLQVGGRRSFPLTAVITLPHTPGPISFGWTLDRCGTLDGDGRSPVRLWRRDQRENSKRNARKHEHRLHVVAPFFAGRSDNVSATLRRGDLKTLGAAAICVDASLETRCHEQAVRDTPLPMRAERNPYARLRSSTRPKQHRFHETSTPHPHRR